MSRRPNASPSYSRISEGARWSVELPSMHKFKTAPGVSFIIGIVRLIFGVMITAGCCAASRLPNIVVIVADDLGYHDLGSYGQNRFPTKNTDRLARDGIRFLNAHAPAAICSPTRYSIITGTDPFRRYHTSHVLFNAEPLVIGRNESTMADMLGSAGYATAIVGKWHLGLGDRLPRDPANPGRGPNQVGFDYSFIVPDGHNMFPAYYLENGEIFQSSEVKIEAKTAILDRVGYKLLQNTPVGRWPVLRSNEQIARTLAEKAERFIVENRARAFFLYYPTCAIHFPFEPDRRFIGASGIGLHGDYVMEFDWAVGEVMSLLERLGVADNTLVMVTSDNGGYPQGSATLKDTGHNPNHPWRGAKESAYEGGTRVPFIARWPGRIGPGKSSEEMISLTDLAATLSEIAGATVSTSAALDSKSFASLLLDPQGGEAPRYSMVTGSRGMTAIALRERHWKMIFSPHTEGIELYNLAVDPGEVEDLSLKERRRARGMLDRLNAYFERGSSRPGAIASGSPLRQILSERDARNREIELKFSGQP